MTEATCEKRGHIFGAFGVCVFCKTPKPEQPPSKTMARCPHGIRLPHECRECESAPPQEEINAFVRRAMRSASPAISYLVTYGGGLGPNVWDAELIVQAPDIRAALDQAEPQVLDAGGVIFSIEQED